MGDLKSDQAKFLRDFDSAEISSEAVSHCFLAQLDYPDTASATAADYQFILDQGRLALISVQNRRQSPVLVDFFVNWGPLGTIFFVNERTPGSIFLHIPWLEDICVLAGGHTCPV